MWIGIHDAVHAYVDSLTRPDGNSSVESGSTWLAVSLARILRIGVEVVDQVDGEFGRVSLGVGLGWL